MSSGTESKATTVERNIPTSSQWRTGTSNLKRSHLGQKLISMGGKWPKEYSESRNCQGDGIRAAEVWWAWVRLNPSLRRNHQADFRFGLPPNLPFAREAWRLAALLERPPASPSRAAIQLRVPKLPSKSAGR